MKRELIILPCLEPFIRFTRLLALALSFLSIAQVKADPPGGTSGWRLDFNDQFSTLDTNSWTKNVPYWDENGNFFTYQPRYQAYFVTGNVTVSNGRLQVVSKRENAGGKSYSSGWVSTANKRAWTYGYFEVRAKFVTTKGADPGFWLFADKTQDWPPELDPAEIPGYQNGTKVQANIHWRDASGNHQDDWEYATIPQNTFVTYGMLWEPDKVVYYIDGQEFHRVTTGIPSVPMFINLATEIDGGPNDTFFGNPAAGTYPITSEVEWVKVWKREGPVHNTVYKIRDQQADHALHSAVQVYSGNSNGNYAITYPANSSSAQQWKAQEVGDGYFRLVNQSSGKDLHESTQTYINNVSGKYVIGFPRNTTYDCQEWRFLSVGGGYYSIVNRLSGNVLHRSGQVYTNDALGRYTITFPYDGLNYQHWRLE